MLGISYESCNSHGRYIKVYSLLKKQKKILSATILNVFVNLHIFLLLVCSSQKYQWTTFFSPKKKGLDLTLVLLNPDMSFFANSVDPDQLASEEAN